MKKVFSTVTIVLLCLAGCKDSGTNPPVALSVDEIQAVVFLYQFSNNESGQGSGAPAYFIGLWVVGDSVTPGYYADFNNDFMARFEGHIPPVKKASRCTTSIYGVFDKQTGERGLLFRVETVRVISATEAEVTGGYFEGGLSASGNRYTVQKINGQWMVVKDVLEWIS